MRLASPLLLLLASMLLPPLARAQEDVGGELNADVLATLHLRLLALGQPVASSSTTTRVRVASRSLAALSQIPRQPVDLPSTQILAMQLLAFDMTAEDCELTLLGVRMQLRGFRDRMGDCFGSLGNVQNAPAGPNRVLLDQLGASSERIGAIVLSGGTPPFAFHQTLDLASFGPSDLDLRGIFSLVPGPGNVGIRQRLELSPFVRARFPFGGFEFEFEITLPGGAATIGAESAILGTRFACCERSTPVGTFFDRGSASELGAASSGTVVADLDADGLADLALLAGDRVDLRLGLGGGAFAPPRAFLISAFASTDLAAGDVDGDGDLDLVALGNLLHVLRNDGNGNFVESGSQAAGFTPSALALGDIDGDGDLDAAVGNTAFSNPTAHVLRNDGAGSFASPTPFGFAGRPTDILLADLDGDGDLDLIAPQRFSDFVAFRRNQGNGTFAAAVGFATLARGGDGPAQMIARDLDRDGDLDFAVACVESSNVLLLRNQSGTFSQASFATFTAPLSNQLGVLACEDIDLDGDLDLAAAEIAFDPSAKMHLFRNDGAGAFTFDASHALGASALGVHLADVDADFDVDLLGGSSFSRTRILVNGCTGTRLAAASVTSFGTGCPGSVGTPALQARNRPVLGALFRAEMSSIAPGLAVFFLGASDTQWNGIPLPLPLAALGLGAQCTAWSSFDLNLNVAHAGVATLQLPVPQLVELIGAQLFVQGASLDPGLATAVPIALSNALRLVAGL